MLQPIQYAQMLFEIVQRPIVFWDTEFSKTQEPVINLVSASVSAYFGTSREHDLDLQEYWLLNNQFEKDQLASYLEKLKEKNAIFLCYGGIAEGRAMQALGLDPSTFDVICLYSEWRQLTHNNNSCQYGTYYTETGFKRRSVPPHFDPRRNKGKDNKEVGFSLVACVGQMFEIFIDSVNKTKMRDLILENKPEYNTAEQLDIMHYCSDDVKYLPAVWYEQIQRLKKAIRMDEETLIKIQINRGAYTSALAKIESEGIPLDLEKARNLRHNHAAAVNELITELVENHYPFFVKQKKNLSDFAGSWVDKYTQFEKFVRNKSIQLYDRWPRTVNSKTKQESNTLSRDDKVLSKYDYIPEIKAYQDVKKQIGQLKWFREVDESKKGQEDFFKSVGSDNRLRCFFGPYGTQTGRNAPPAKKFIFAMSSWLRCLIKPPEGYTILSLDYESQEFGIAAVMSKDPEMMNAYRSGDPYLYLAKRAGAVPNDANNKWCKDPNVAPEEEQEKYLKYKDQRNLFKNLTLGLQYGLGAASLAKDLTITMGRKVPLKEAESLIAMHQKIYKVYWRNLKTITKDYQRKKCIVLQDGWSLLKDNSQDLSVRNFPVQGTGGVILRHLAIRAQEKQVPFIALLHDGVYAICKNENLELLENILRFYMDEATEKYLGKDLPIRIETELHKHDEPWVEDKGRKHYALLKKYLEHIEGSKERLDKVLNSIYS